MVHLCKTIISPGFFSFFKILIFHVVRGSKKAKNGPKMRKNSFCCPPYLRNHTSWFSFLLNMCKMMTSPDAFFIFSKFWTFQVVREVEGQKTVQMTKHSVCRAPDLRWWWFICNFSFNLPLTKCNQRLNNNNIFNKLLQLLFIPKKECYRVQ